MMMDFDFAAFQMEFGLTREFAGKVFGISRRTVSRWRTLKRIPRTALRLVMTIQLRAAPWNSSFGVGAAPNYRRGMPMLPWEWREVLFAPPGGHWQDFRTQGERQRLAAAVKTSKARQAAEVEARRLSRLRAARKGAETRRLRALEADRLASVGLDTKLTQGHLSLVAQLKGLPPRRTDDHGIGDAGAERAPNGEGGQRALPLQLIPRRKKHAADDRAHQPTAHQPLSGGRADDGVRLAV